MKNTSRVAMLPMLEFHDVGLFGVATEAVMLGLPHSEPLRHRAARPMTSLASRYAGKYLPVHSIGSRTGNADI